MWCCLYEFCFEKCTYFCANIKDDSRNAPKRQGRWIWSIAQYLAAPFSHCKAMIDNMVHKSGPYLIWYAPLSLASSASSSVLPLYPSTMHPYSSSSSRLLTLIVSWMFIHRHNLQHLCCPLSICFPIEGSRDAPLNYFREPVYNWLIYILFISESQDSLAQFMANLQKVS